MKLRTRMTQADTKLYTVHLDDQIMVCDLNCGYSFSVMSLLILGKREVKGRGEIKSRFHGQSWVRDGLQVWKKMLKTTVKYIT